MRYKIVQPALLLAVQAVLKVIISKSATALNAIVQKRNQKTFLMKINYTLMLKSLKASFKLVFLSVLSLRWPIIKAQLTPKEPAGKSLL